MMPILHFPGEMIPGQFGPMRRVFDAFNTAATRTMSSDGMPSVMQTTSGNSALDGFEDCVRGIRRRHENNRRVGAGFVHGLGDGVEYGPVKMLCAALAGRDAADDLRAVLNHLLRVEAAFASGEALDDDASIFVNENAHVLSIERDEEKVSLMPPIPSWPALRSFPLRLSCPSATVKFRPESRRISWPCLHVGAFHAYDDGNLEFQLFAAFTTPLASTSQRRMPPKMFTKTPFTFGSLSRMRKAFFTCSSEAPPPTSRKFAGLPPLSLMMSMVAMARPAPLTMQPMVPSSLM